MKHPIDQYFKDKLSERELSFEPGDWENARHLIQSRRKRRKRMIWIFFFVGLALIISGLAYQAFSPRFAQEPEIQFATQTDNANSDPLQSNAQNDLLDRTDSSVDIDPVQGQIDYEENQTTKIQPQSIVTREFNITSESAEYELLEMKASLQNSKIADSEKNESVAQTTHESSEKLTIQNGNSTVEKSAELTHLDEKTILNDDPLSGSIPIINEQRAISLSKLQVGQILKPVVSQTNLDLPSLPQPMLIQTIDPKESTLQPYFVGLAYGYLLQARGNESNETWNGHELAVTINGQLSRNLVLQSGIGLKYINGQFAASQTAERFSRDGGFGFQREILQLKPEGAYFLKIPLFAAYQAGRHSIGLTVAMNKTLGVHGIKTSRVYDQNTLVGRAIDSARPENSSVTDVWIPSSTFRSIHWEAGASYKFEANKIFTFGIGVRYMLNGLYEHDQQPSNDRSTFAVPQEQLPLIPGDGNDLLFSLTLEARIWN